VAVARPVGRAERIDVDGDHPRRVRAVDERVDSPATELGDDLGDRQDER
jgi:hypothetical protein